MKKSVQMSKSLPKWTCLSKSKVSQSSQGNSPLLRPNIAVTDEESGHFISTNFPVNQNYYIWKHMFEKILPFVPLGIVICWIVFSVNRLVVIVTCYEALVLWCYRLVSSVLLVGWTHVWGCQSLLSRDNSVTTCWYTGGHFSDISCKFPRCHWSDRLARFCSSSCKNAQSREDRGREREGFCISILMFCSRRESTKEQWRWGKYTFCHSVICVQCSH